MVKKNPRARKLRFKDLSIGSYFEFVSGWWGPSHFGDPYRKDSARGYTDRDGVKHKVGSINVEVKRARKDPAAKNPRARSSKKTIAGPRGSGLKAIYSPVNQAWLLMWKDQVLRVINSRAEVLEEMKDLLRGTSFDPRKKNPRRRNSERARKRAKPLFDLGALPVIGDQVLTIDYQGGDGKPAGSKWTHDFKKQKTRAKIFGLPDGSLLIKGTKRLWRMFQ